MNRVTAAWSVDESVILDFEHTETGTVKVSEHYIDEFDADDDYSVTVGEFSVEALRRALLAPVPLTEHAANKRANPLTWLTGRRRAA